MKSFRPKIETAPLDEFVDDGADGRKISAADPNDPGKRIRVYPSLSERTEAVRALLKRLVPDLRSAEISGLDGDPVQTHTSQMNDFEMARRIAFILATAAHNKANAEAAIQPVNS